MAGQIQFSTNLGLDGVPNPADPKQFTDFLRVYNAIRALAANLDTYTGPLQYDSSIWDQLSPAQTLWTAGANRLYLPTTDTLAAGSMCSIWNNSGVPSIRKSGGAGWAGGNCCGYSTGVYAAAGMAEIILFGLCTLVTGLTPGATYYVSNGTAGAFTGTRPTINGEKYQPIGYAITSTALFFNPPTAVPTVDTSLGIAVLTP